MQINKPRQTGVVATDPVSRTKRIQFNHDYVAAVPAIPAQGETPAVPAVLEQPATLTVLVDFFSDQAAMDAGEAPFETISYQTDEPAALENLINTELKLLADFDAAV